MIGRKIVYKDTLDSTNNYIANLSSKGEIKHGDVILAGKQTAGKGQREAKWDSEPYKNLILSIFLDHVNLSVTHHFYLTQAVSLALIDFLKNYGSDFKIKWPNDIVHNASKIAGILIETQIENGISDHYHIRNSIVGIGININQENFNEYNATSLKLITQKEYQLQDLLFKLIETLNFRINQLETLQFKTLNKEYLSDLWLYEQESRYQSKGIEFVGKIIGVDENGKLLILEKESNKILSFENKELLFLERFTHNY